MKLDYSKLATRRTTPGYTSGEMGQQAFADWMNTPSETQYQGTMPGDMHLVLSVRKKWAGIVAAAQDSGHVKYDSALYVYETLFVNRVDVLIDLVSPETNLQTIIDDLMTDPGALLDQADLDAMIAEGNETVSPATTDGQPTIKLGHVDSVDESIAAQTRGGR